MVKDRIENELRVGDKVHVSLPENSIIGFVSQIEEGGVISKTLGRVLVSYVVALPVDPQFNVAPQLVKVYDANATKTAENAILRAMESTSEEKPN